ncbi:MAG: hypothetical protein ACXADY_14535 [Candidatus Hodarchaeales archaeon]|jgi:hypothetical protein
MKKDDGTIQQTNDSIHSQILEFNARQRKRANRNLVFTLLLFVCEIIILHSFLDVLMVPFRTKMVVIVSILVVISWIMFIPYLGVLAIIIFRTKHYDFALELLTLLQFAIWPILTIIGLRVMDSNDTVIVGLFIVLLPAFIALISYIFIKKPVFWQTSKNPLEYYGSTILSQHALQITERRDGYSQRPFFSNFHEIRSYCSSSVDFKLKIENYVRFLNHNGELIGWEVYETKVVLYPRVLMSLPNFPFGIRSLYQLLIRVYMKRGLTAVTINFASEEVSLHINRDDYNELGDVTYHVLGEQILEKIKKSIVAFMQKDLSSSYSTMFPVDPEIKKIKQKQKLARPKFLVLPVAVEIIFGALLLLWYGFVLLIVLPILIILDIQTTYLPNIILWTIAIVLIGMGFIMLGLGLWRLQGWAWTTSVIMTSGVFLWFVIYALLELGIILIGENGNFLWLILPLIPLMMFLYLIRTQTYFQNWPFRSDKLLLGNKNIGVEETD